MAEYNIVMKQKNNTGEYDTLYPATVGSQVSGMTMDMVEGSLDAGRISGNLSIDQITGQIPSTQVSISEFAETVIFGNVENRNLDLALITLVSKISGGIVSITITDTQGQPVPNTFVDYNAISSTSPRTDASGQVFFTGLELQKYTFNIQYPLDYTGTTTSLQVDLTTGEPQVLTISNVSFQDITGILRITETGYVTFGKEYTLDFFGVGGGASGAAVAGDRIIATAGGGGSGYTQTINNVTTTLNDYFYITIGAGGDSRQAKSSGTTIRRGGLSGGNTSIQKNGFSILTAQGGTGGQAESTNIDASGGNGGSGGGMGDRTVGPDRASRGGSDGSNGTLPPGQSEGYQGNPGTGQGRTTRAFGESSGELFAGGGSGGSIRYEATQIPGGDGGGGYGIGGTDDDYPSGSTVTAGSGAPNTGSGGGGAACSETNVTVNSGSGGSGIVLIRKSVA